MSVRQAILNPEKIGRRGYQRVEVQLAGGRVLRGVARNEDTFSIQMMDETGRLHMLLKKDVVRIDHPSGSIMPKPELADSELNDLLAFLEKKEASPALAEWHPEPDLDVTFGRIRHASSEPQNWLTYWGDYGGTHYSRLNEITPANAESLAPKWSFQFGAGPVESVPLVVDGLMFVTGPSNNAQALDARTGRPIWRYTRPLPAVAAHRTVMTNRGVAIWGDRLFMGTLDAHLISLDAKTGAVIWDVAVEEYQKGFPSHTRRWLSMGRSSLE